MFMHMCIHVYVCIYVYKYKYIHIYIYIYIYIYICIHTAIDISIYRGTLNICSGSETAGFGLFLRDGVRLQACVRASPPPSARVLPLYVCMYKYI